MLLGYFFVIKILDSFRVEKSALNNYLYYWYYLHLDAQPADLCKKRCYQLNLFFYRWKVIWVLAKTGTIQYDLADVQKLFRRFDINVSWRRDHSIPTPISNYYYLLEVICSNDSRNLMIILSKRAINSPHIWKQFMLMKL